MTELRSAATLAGQAIPLAGWVASAGIGGGFEELRGQAPEQIIRALDARQGDTLRLANAESNQTVWEGRLSVPPYYVGGAALLSAGGHKKLLTNRHERLFYQTRDLGLFAQMGSDPHNYSVNDVIQATVNKGDISFTVAPQAVTSGQRNGVLIWIPGAFIRRYAFRIRGLVANSQISTFRATGPAGTLTSIADHTANASVDQPVSGDPDLLVIALKFSANFSPASTIQAVIDRVRINGRAIGDSFTVTQIVNDVADQAGLDSAHVGANTLSPIPLDWNDSWDRLYDYLAELTDQWWGVFEDQGSGPRLELRSWGRRTWTVFLREGAKPALVPQPLYNRVVVRYRLVTGAIGTITLDADPNPLPAGVLSVYEQVISDPVGDTTLPTAVANALLAQISRVRYAGTLDLGAILGDDGDTDLWAIRPGDLLRIADWGPAESRELRVWNAEYRPNGVRVSVEMPVGAGRLLAMYALEQSRKSPVSRVR